jgi:hypothetical protein
MSDEKKTELDVDPELRDRFLARASAEHQPAVQVLEDLMREYLAREPAPADLRLRRQALRYATASVALEGFRPNAESDRRATLHAEGKITFAQMIDLDSSI